MKRIFLIAIILVSFLGFSQSNLSLIGDWNGGVAFDGSNQDSILLFHFDDSTFRFNYGPNHYTEYKTYSSNGDTLTLIKDDGFQEAVFLIDTLLGTGKLEIQAINWTAVHITSTLCSPYNSVNAPNLPLNGPFETETIFENDVVRTRLSFTRIDKN